MRKRVAREWLWVAILVIVAAFALLLNGCAKAESEINRGTLNKEPVKKAPPFSKQLDWGLYAFEFEGHTYLWDLDGFILHSAGCKGDHE